MCRSMKDRVLQEAWVICRARSACSAWLARGDVSGDVGTVAVEASVAYVAFSGASKGAQFDLAAQLAHAIRCLELTNAASACAVRKLHPWVATSTWWAYGRAVKSGYFNASQLQCHREGTDRWHDDRNL